MKKLFLSILALITLFSCAPILSQDLIDKGIFNIQLSEIKKNPPLYKEKIFILGGVIINTTITEKGSLIEAIHVPVDSKGYIENVVSATSRYIAIYPKDKGLLAPMIFHKNRRVTFAGKFIGIQIESINDMAYIYPVFEIEEFHLWKEWKTNGSGRTVSQLERQQTVPIVEEVQIKNAAIHTLSESEQQQLNKAKTEEVIKENDKLPEEEQTVDPRQSLTKPVNSHAVDERQSESYIDDTETGKPIAHEPTKSVQIKGVTEETEKLKEKDKIPDLNQSLVKAVSTGSNEYYVQVGTWRNSKYAEAMLVKVKKYYPKAYMSKHNNFNKIRIPDIPTKKQGIIVSREIEEKFNIKPLLVLKLP